MRMRLGDDGDATEMRGELYRAATKVRQAGDGDATGMKRGCDGDATGYGVPGGCGVPGV